MSDRLPKEFRARSTLPLELQPNPDAVDPLAGIGFDTETVAPATGSILQGTQLTEAQRKALAAFNALTPEQQERVREERRVMAELYGQRPIDKFIIATDYAALRDPTPASDIFGTVGRVARGVVDDESAGEIGSNVALGMAAAYLPFYSAKKLAQLPGPSGIQLRAQTARINREVARRTEAIDADLVAGNLTPAQAAAKRNQLEILKGGQIEKAEEEYFAEALREKQKRDAFDKADHDFNMAGSGRKTGFFEAQIPRDALDNLLAYPDSPSTKTARSVLREIIAKTTLGPKNPDYLTRSQAAERIKREMPVLGRNAEREAGEGIWSGGDSQWYKDPDEVVRDRWRVGDKGEAVDVMERRRASAAAATAGKKSGQRTPDRERDLLESEDRALRNAAKEENEFKDRVAPGRQPIDYEKTYFNIDPKTGKTAARKLKPGSRVRLEQRRREWREAGRKGPDGKPTPEPRLTDADYVPSDDEALFAHQRKIKTEEELKEARTKLQSKAFPETPSAQKIAGDEAYDALQALRAQAQEVAARKAFDRNPRFNDTELEMVAEATAMGEGDQARDLIFAMRIQGKRFVKNPIDGNFDILDEGQEIIGAADLEGVNRDFLRRQPRRTPSKTVNREIEQGERSRARSREAAGVPAYVSEVPPRGTPVAESSLPTKPESTTYTTERVSGDTLRRRPKRDEASDLSKKTVRELKAEAKKLGVKGYYKMRKADLIERIMGSGKGSKVEATDAAKPSKLPTVSEPDPATVDDIAAKVEAKSLARRKALRGAPDVVEESDLPLQHLPTKPMAPKPMAAKAPAKGVKDARPMAQRVSDLEESPNFDLDAQEAFEADVRAEQAASRGGYVGDESDYLDQVYGVEQQAKVDKDFAEKELLDQAREDSFPTMSELELLDNVEEAKRIFKDNPDVLEEIAEIEAAIKPAAPPAATPTRPLRFKDEDSQQLIEEGLRARRAAAPEVDAEGMVLPASTDPMKLAEFAGVPSGTDAASLMSAQSRGPLFELPPGSTGGKYEFGPVTPTPDVPPRSVDTRPDPTQTSVYEQRYPLPAGATVRRGGSTTDAKVTRDDTGKLTFEEARRKPKPKPKPPTDEELAAAAESSISPLTKQRLDLGVLSGLIPESSRVAGPRMTAEQKQAAAVARLDSDALRGRVVEDDTVDAFKANISERLAKRKQKKAEKAEAKAAKKTEKAEKKAAKKSETGS